MQKQEQQTVKKPAQTVRRILFWVCIGFAVCYIAYYVVCKFFLGTVEITGRSMQKTIYGGDRVILQNENYTPQQGDVVVVAENGTGLDTAIIKRVIAVAGQTVDIDFTTGTVWVDGEMLDESSYTVNGSTTDRAGVEFPQTVPQDCVFLLGDNRGASEDSRDPKVGMVNTHFVLGKAVMVIYPLHHIKLL